MPARSRSSARNWRRASCLVPKCCVIDATAFPQSKRAALRRVAPRTIRGKPRRGLRRGIQCTTPLSRRRRVRGARPKGGRQCRSGRITMRRRWPASTSGRLKKRRPPGRAYRLGTGGSYDTDGRSVSQPIDVATQRKVESMKPSQECAVMSIAAHVVPSAPRGPAIPGAVLRGADGRGGWHGTLCFYERAAERAQRHETRR